MTISLPAIYLCFLILCRGSALLYNFPFGSSNNVPNTVKIGLSVGLSYTLFLTLSPTTTLPLPSGYLPFLLHIGKEIMIGWAMGITLRISFAIFETAGYCIANEMGLNNSEIFNPSSEQSNNFISLMFSQLAIAIFFINGVYLDLLQCFVDSYRWSPIQELSLSSSQFLLLIPLTQNIFTVAFKMAVPLIALNLLITFAFSILGKTSPKINVFFLSFPLRILLGLSLLSFILYLCYSYITNEFARIPPTMNQITHG